MVAVACNHAYYAIWQQWTLMKLELQTPIDSHECKCDTRKLPGKLPNSGVSFMLEWVTSKVKDESEMQDRRKSSSQIGSTNQMKRATRTRDEKCPTVMRARIQQITSSNRSNSTGVGRKHYELRPDRANNCSDLPEGYEQESDHH